MCGSINIVTHPWTPLVNCTIGTSNKSLFTGYYISLIKEIALTLKWDDSEWTLTCLSFSDMMSSISAGNADIAIGSISITSDRLKTLQFSTPTYDSGLVIITHKNPLSLIWLIFMPFDYTMWVTIIVYILLNAHLIWMAEQHDDGPIHITYSIGILESIHHSFLSILLLGDLKLRTVGGRAIQITYWFLGLMIIALYLSNLSAMLSINWLSSNIQSYQDLQNSKIGSFSQYESEMQIYSNNIVNYDWTYEASQQMFNDLSSGLIDAAIQPYPYSIYLTGSNCDMIMVGQRFVIDYFAIAFPINKNNTLYKQVTQINLDLYLNNYHRDLENEFVFVSSTGTCDYSADIPLNINGLAGVWYVLAICGFVSLFLSVIYLKMCKRLESKLLEKSTIIKNVDLHQAAEFDLISRFENVLRSSEHKLMQKIKDLQTAMARNSSYTSEFKDTLNNFAQRLS